ESKLPALECPAYKGRRSFLFIRSDSGHGPPFVNKLDQSLATGIEQRISPGIGNPGWPRFTCPIDTVIDKDRQQIGQSRRSQSLYHAKAESQNPVNRPQHRFARSFPDGFGYPAAQSISDNEQRNK